MKLGKLNAAIRARSGAPKITWNSPVGPLDIEIVKTSLLEALKAAYPEGKAQETDLMFTSDGRLIHEATAPAGPDIDDLDALGLDAEPALDDVLG